MNVTVTDVLGSLFNPTDTVCFRVFDDKKGGVFQGSKLSCECGKYKSIEETLKNHNAMNRGIFFVVNYGGQDDDSITRINAQFVEMDNDSFEDQQKKIDAFPLPPSMIMKTQKSYHVYWFMDSTAKVERFRMIQTQLVKHFDGDPMCVNESRVMRLPGFMHCKKDTPVEVTCVSFHPERKYTQDQLSDVLPEVDLVPVERKSGTEKGIDQVMRSCTFMQHCRDDAASLSEHDWYAMITNLAPFEGGTKMIHDLSAPYPGYSEGNTQKKINHFLESGTNPITCKTICEKGFNCPKFAAGECPVKSPAAWCYQPMSADALLDILHGIPVTGEAIKDLQAANSSIRQILSNITYTGNLLFQKEYVSDPITGKSKINHGELPQYFVENTHEAIIPMETYQAVQKERERRRELGALANWSINTSCFTSKIKCGICGKSYRRSGKRQRKNTDEVYYIWICRTKSDRGAKYCSAKSIPEKTLKAVCVEILGTDEFDGDVFSEKVEQITVIGEDTLKFHFFDGSVLEKKWQSTAKTDWWTEERRTAWGELHKHKATNPNRRRFYEFTGFIKCGQCGENFRCQGTKLKDGTQIRTWHCGRTCGNITVRDELLKDMVCDAMHMPEFSEERMDAELEQITVDGQTIIFHFRDGHTEYREYVKPKKKGSKHTEEFKAHMRELMKTKWKEGKMHGAKKSDDHSGNNQPVHGDTD